MKRRFIYIYNNYNFISTWKTDNSGVSNSDQIKLPLVSGGTYDFIVDWGDGTNSNITSYDQPETTHTYPTLGTYTLTISGILKKWSFGYYNDSLKLINISNWGILKMENGDDTTPGMQFYNCSNMTCTANDYFYTENITNTSSMFKQCNIFNANLSGLDFSNIINSKEMFMYCLQFNSDLSNWDVSNVQNMESMFYYCTKFNSNISSWNISNVTNTSYMFNQCSKFNQNISTWNVENVTNMSSMFYNCFDFNINLGSWKINNVTNMANMFDNCGLSTENYSNILIGWASLAVSEGVQHNVSLGALGIKYNSSAVSSRNILTNSPYNWVITDDGLLE